MKTAAEYGRYSTDNQTANSIAYQFAEIRKYCKDNNIDIVASFKDEAMSGTNTARPGFQALLAAAQRHEFAAVVIYDISRGSRDVADWFSFRRTMDMLGVEVISVNQKLGDIAKPSDFLVELINVGLGQHQVLESRQKSIAGVAMKAREGVFLGGVAPLGYDIQNGSYVVNEPEARAVRSIFTMYAAGHSYSDILSAVSWTHGKRGQPLGNNSLHSILKNERYIGVYSWNKRKIKHFRKWAGGGLNPNGVRIENAIPPIIDLTTWERVQNRLNDNKRNAQNKAKEVYLLSGLIECEACGAAYVGHTSTNKKGYKTRYYTCGNRYRTHTCYSKNINADEIEVFVVQNLKRYFLETDFNEAAQYIANQVNSSSADLSQERAELRSIEAKINNGVNAILSGTRFPELEDEVERLRVRRSELHDIINRRTMSSRKVDPAAIVRLFQSALDNWDTNLPEIIRQHIAKIYAHEDGTYSVSVGVHLAGCGGRI